MECICGETHELMDVPGGQMFHCPSMGGPDIGIREQIIRRVVSWTREHGGEMPRVISVSDEEQAWLLANDPSPYAVSGVLVVRRDMIA